MKKFLLSLFSMAAFAGMALANTATVTFSELGYENGEEVTTVKVNGDITISLDKGSNNNTPKYYNAGTGIRLYGGNTMTITGAEGVTITEAVFSTSTGSNAFNSASTASAGTFSIDGGTATWTGEEKTFTITQGGSSGHVRIQSIEFTYTGGGNVTPDPDPTTAEAADLATFMKGQTGVLTTIKSDAVAVYQLGNNLWIKDNSAWMLVYGSTGQEYENGDVIPAGYQGEYSPYNGLPEMTKPANFTKGTKGAAIEPTLVNTGDADAEPINSYIKMTGCTITGSGRSYKCDDGSGEVTLYTNSASFSVPTGSGLTVYAFVSIYGENYQMTPVEITTDSGREIVATPTFTPAAGVVNKGDKVSIKCATEGATIYYTLDGTNPNAESNLYSEPITITEDVTIKALAVKEGWDDSDIATAAYTVIIPSDNDVLFNFADFTTLTPTYPESDFEPDGNTGNFLVNVEDVAFTAKGVSVKAVYTDPANTGTQARLYKQAAGTCSYRVYNKSSIVITAPENNSITKIAYEFYNGKTSYDKLNAPAEGTWAAPVWTNETGVEEAIFVCVGTQQIKTITVTLKNVPTGVDGVAVDNENAPVEYFNLQGVRVQNPENGLFIRRQGTSVSKVIIR